MDSTGAAIDVLAQGSSRYTHSLREVFGTIGPPSQCFAVPALGGELRNERLSASALAARDRIVCTLAQQYSVQYFPQIPSLVAMMLEYMSEVETFVAVVRTHRPCVCIPTSRTTDCIRQERLLIKNSEHEMLLSSSRIEEAFVASFMCVCNTRVVMAATVSSLLYLYAQVPCS